MKYSSLNHFLLLGLAALPFNAHAASNTWVGTTNVWDTGAAANWTSPTTWTSGDDAVFGTPGAGGLALALTTVTAHNLDFNTTGYILGGSTLTLNGSTPTITTATSVVATINSQILGSAGLTKSGAGEAILGGTLGYTGNTAINQGTLTFKAPSDVNWTLNGGTKTVDANAVMKVDFSAQTTQFRNTNIGNVVLNGTLNLSGTAANINGFYVVNGLSVTSGAGNIDIIDNGSVIINSANALNSFTGIINVGDATGMSQFTSQGSTSTTGTFAMNITANGTYDLRTDSFVMGALNGSGATIKSHNGFTGTLMIGNGGANGNYSGTMSDQATVYNVTKTGAGTQILSATNNTYSGVTTVNGGVLSVTTLKDGGTASSIGDASNVATNLVINGGTLKYTGAVQSTNRNFMIGTNGGTLNASGTGALTITGGPTMTGGTTRTLTLTGSNTDANTMQAAIGNGAGATSLTKNGDGTWVLTAASHGYTGTTTVTAGKLVINGNVSTATTVNGTGTLGGTGTVGALTVASGGTLAPGNSAGIFNANGNTNLQALSNFDVELNGNILGGPIAGTNYDQLNVTGTVTLAGALNLTIGSAPVYGELFFILANNDADAITGTFSNAPTNGSTYTLGGQQFEISYFANQTGPGVGAFTGGNDVVLMAVPEPNVAALLGGVGMLALLRRRS